jgi:hypothetical protein
MKHSLTDLFRTLLNDFRTLLRQELLLVKTELAEKASRVGRNAMALAIGGSAAYAGLIVLLIGFGCLIAWAFTIVGIPPLLANFIGLGLVGLLVSGGGAMLLFKALHTFSKESFVPEKSVEAIEHLKELRRGPEPAKAPQSELETKSTRSPEEMKQAAFKTEEMLDRTLDEIQSRVSPRQIARRMKQRVVEHPVRVGVTLLSLAAGFAGAVLVRRRFRHT